MHLLSEFFKLAPLNPFRGTAPKIAVKDSWIPINKTYIGIEVEVENVRAWGDPYTLWAMKEDGSLRNGGREYVSIPLNGENVPIALLHLFQNLNEDIQFSHRTSIHVHVNVQNLTLDSITGIILTYLAVEPLLFKFVGHDRDKSIFCVPLYETELPNRLVSRFLKNPALFRMENARYAALNLDAMRKFGTLEFRHLFGTSDMDILMTWINLILSIVEFGSSQSVEKLASRILPLNTNSFYIAFVNDVFGKLASVLDLTAVKFDLEKGVKSVKASMLEGKLYMDMMAQSSAESELTSWSHKRLSRRLHGEVSEFRWDTPLPVVEISSDRDPDDDPAPLPRIVASTTTTRRAR